MSDSRPVKVRLGPTPLRLLDAAVEHGFGSRSEVVAMCLVEVLRGKLPERHALDLDWEDFADRIRAQDGKPTTNGGSMTVFSHPQSYEAEIETCQDLWRSNEHFAEMSAQERAFVAGFGPETTGFLGRMEGAAHFKPVVRNHPEQIGKWLDQVPLYGAIDDALERKVLKGLLKIKGVALASATRLLASKRPDLYLSVNGANIDNVNEFLRRLRAGSSVHRVDDYLETLRLIRSFRWFNAPKPRPGRGSRKERFIWSARIALLDAIMYEDVDVEGEE